ncbi:MAG: hypothetical protein H7X89_15900 [Rhizobiales bacterium]|nr:hypothetical protein [Hyphomicrobiales bacterium]
MRNAVYAFMLLAAAPEALAGGQTVQANASFSAQIVATTDNDAEITQQEKNLKRAMYERAARECTDIMASVATSCSITGINVSTQINRNYGQPPTIYVNSSVTMQVTLK